MIAVVVDDPIILQFNIEISVVEILSVEPMETTLILFEFKDAGKANVKLRSPVTDSPLMVT